MGPVPLPAAGSGAPGAEPSVTRTGAGSVCPRESAEGTWARVFGGAVRRRWDPTVSARGAPGDHTHTHHAQGTWRGKCLPLPNLMGDLERARSVSLEQQLHSRRGSGPTLDKSSDFTLYVQEKQKQNPKPTSFCDGGSAGKQGPPSSIPAQVSASIWC